jgi:diguanylate cyclase (GGDEF)-like protein
VKLTTKINYIILPIISSIFIFAGVLSYFSQKAIVLKSLENKMEYQSQFTIRGLENNLIELDSLLKQIINSIEVSRHLTHSDIYTNYNSGRQLIRFISNIAKNSGSAVIFELRNSREENLFYFDANDPFTEPTHSPNLLNHIRRINHALSDDKSIRIETTTFTIESISEHQLTINVFHTFSPEQSIYEEFFSSNSTLYTAKISRTIDITDQYLQLIQAAFGNDASLVILPNGVVHQLNKDLAIIFNTISPTAISATNALATTKISIAPDYVNARLLPYLIAIASVVINVTLLSFYLLKLLIRRQIINPIEQLNNQVEQAIHGDHKALKVIHSDDEVSSLNNNYIKLLDDLNTLARRDSLTGLANRAVFSSALIRSIKQAVQHSSMCALYFIDLDNFKHINDTHGHQIGDQVLIEFAKQLSACFRKEDIIVRPNLYSDVARIAGDEFALILPHPYNIDIVGKVAQRIVDICANGLTIDTQTFDVRVSVGVAVSPSDADNADQLMKYADAAMYQVKKNGKNGYQFYSKILEEEQKRHQLIEKSLQTSLALGQFYLVFMPILDCHTGTIAGLETLIRSTNDILKSTGPDEYIPIAETAGLIKDIDLWVIDASLKQLKLLIEQYQFTGFMAINFSSWELKNPTFATSVERLINHYDISPSHIELEITETCLITNSDETTLRLSELKALGIRLSLDDFGTGYTGFNQLHTYPVDCLKVDRSFINAIGTNQTSAKPLVDIIIELASLYQLRTVAEGIETEEQFRYITQLGCDFAQGYLLSKPLEWDGLIQYIGQHNPNDLLKFYGANDLTPHR